MTLDHFARARATATAKAIASKWESTPDGVVGDEQFIACESFFAIEEVRSGSFAGAKEAS